MSRLVVTPSQTVGPFFHYAMPWRGGGMIERVRRSWAEIEYAQRRIFELGTGIVLPATRRRTHIDDLEALFALPTRGDPPPRSRVSSGTASEPARSSAGSVV